MKIAGIIGIISVLIVLVLVIYLSRYGLFAPVNITEKSTGPYLLVYEKHVGDYKNTGSIMDKLYYDLKDNFSIEATKGFGLYYDDPREIETGKLRSIVGCIVESKSAEDLKILGTRYGIKEFPVSESVVVEFPYNGKLSIILGIFKVYPKLGVYMENHKYVQTPIMEIYDQPNKKIEYISAVGLPTELFDDFLK